MMSDRLSGEVILALTKRAEKAEAELQDADDYFEEIENEVVRITGDLDVLRRMPSHRAAGVALSERDEWKAKYEALVATNEKADAQTDRQYRELEAKYEARRET